MRTVPPSMGRDVRMSIYGGSYLSESREEEVGGQKPNLLPSFSQLISSFDPPASPVPNCVAPALLHPSPSPSLSDEPRRSSPFLSAQSPPFTILRPYSAPKTVDEISESLVLSTQQDFSQQDVQFHPFSVKTTTTTTITHKTEQILSVEIDDKPEGLHAGTILEDGPISPSSLSSPSKIFQATEDDERQQYGVGHFQYKSERPKDPFIIVTAESLLAMKKGTDKKRFSHKERAVLESVFQHNKFPDHVVREKLAEDLQIDSKKIRTWFQKRRTRMRKEIKKKP